MPMLSRFVVLFATLGLLAGCAGNPQQVMVSPTVDLGLSGSGLAVPVALKVVDSRERPTILGYRAPGEASLDKAVLARNPVDDAVYQTLARGLRQQGFMPRPAGGADGSDLPRLVVTIRTIDYSRSGSGINGIASTEVVLNGAASSAGRTFEATYRVVDQSRASLLQSAEDNARVINQALGKAIKNLLTDNRLIAVLRG